MTNLKLGVPASELCNECLLGVHNECHQEIGTLENHPYGEAVVRGHFIRGQVDFAEIQSRHNRVVEEMEKRGFEHDSPLPSLPGIAHCFMGNWFMEKINELAVKDRCRECRL